MAAQSAPTELGTKSINSLIRQYAVPGIIAMTASSLYNMVDSIFIGHIPQAGALAISGLAVTFPLMNISAALGTLVGVGAATMISVLLGQKNYGTAGKVLSNEVTLNIIVGLVFTVATLLFMDPILLFFGASQNTLPYARDYMVIISIGNVFTHLYFGLNSVIRSSGNPRLAMNLTLFTVISNAILDPVFIFVLGMGIRGAALATVICQIAALAYTLYYFFDRKKFLHLDRRRPLQLDWRIAKDSLAIGMGPFLMNLASCIVVLFINNQLLKYGGDLAIGAYGIANRISFLFAMVVVGFNHGMQPIAGYNYGARQYSRVREVYVKTSLWATAVMTVGFIISEFLSAPAVSLFTHDPELTALAERGIRQMNIVFPIIGFQMVTTNLFQCLGMVQKSIFLSLTRQLLFLVPCVYILPSLMGSEAGVWYSFPISDFLASVLTAIFAVDLLRKLGHLKDGDDPSILGSKI
ncbi:MAG: MATE family efflux transporter [Bacteroidales bacterium]|nr:MATE family efflux transporter [Bacteroidales bacterium]